MINKYLNICINWFSMILTPYCIQTILWLEKYVILPFAEWFYTTKLYIIYDTIFNWFFIRQFTILYKWYLIKDDDVRTDIYIAWVRRTFKRLRRAQDYELEFVHHWIYLLPILIFSIFYFLTTPLDFEIIFKNFIYLFYLKKLYMFVFLRHTNKHLWDNKYWNKYWCAYPKKFKTKWSYWGLPLTFVRYVNINVKYHYYFTYYFNDIYKRLDFFWIIWENYYELSRLFWYLALDEWLYPQYIKISQTSILYRKLNLFILPRFFKKNYSSHMLFNFFRISDSNFFCKNFINYTFISIKTYIYLNYKNPVVFLKPRTTNSYSLIFLTDLKNYFLRYYIYIYTWNVHDKLLFLFRFLYNSYYFLNFAGKYTLCILWLVNPFLVINPSWYRFISPFFKNLQFSYNNRKMLPTIFNYGYQFRLNNQRFINLYTSIKGYYMFVQIDLNQLLATTYFNKLNELSYLFTIKFYNYVNELFVDYFSKYEYSLFYLSNFQRFKCSKKLYQLYSNWVVKYWFMRLL